MVEICGNYFEHVKLERILIKNNNYQTTLYGIDPRLNYKTSGLSDLKKKS